MAVWWEDDLRGFSAVAVSGWGEACVPEVCGGAEGEGRYERMWGLYERVRGVEGVKGYLESERRMRYGMGIWRYYEELDE